MSRRSGFDQVDLCVFVVGVVDRAAAAGVNYIDNVVVFENGIAVALFQAQARSGSSDQEVVFLFDGRFQRLGLDNAGEFDFADADIAARAGDGHFDLTDWPRIVRRDNGGHIVWFAFRKVIGLV